MATRQSNSENLFHKIINYPLFRIFDRSLRARLVVFFALITVVTVSTVGFISYRQVWRSIESSTTESTLVIAEQLKTNVELVFRDAERFLKIGTHDTTMSFLSPLQQSEESTYRLSLEIIELFNLFREIYEFDSRIKGIHILGFNGNNIGEQEGRYKLSVDLTELKTVQTAMLVPGEVFLIPNRTIDYAGFESYDDVISIARVIVRPVTRELMGVIIVDVDRQAITGLCENIKIGDTGHFLIISDKGEVLYPLGLDISGIPISEQNIGNIIEGDSGSLVDRTGGFDELYSYATLKPWSWKIVGRVKMAELMKNAYRIRNMTVLAIVLALVLSTVLYFFFSDAITHPIRDLMAVMKNAESGNLFVRAESKRHDEINDLCNGFNRMLGEVRELMTRVIREHEDLQKSELKALQAQINPHFLYNTLDAIVWMAEAGSTDDVVQMTKSLSNFFRLSLSKGREWVTCMDEIEHVRCYLEIQKMRHKDLLDFTITDNIGPGEFQVLKLILQPIVENAVDHGIKGRRRGGKVIISGIRSGESLIFRVIDDGIGIPLDRLDDIRNEMNERSDPKDTGTGIETGYGLRNVHQRLRLYYGAGYGIEIESSEGIGTEVRLTLPVQKMG